MAGRGHVQVVVAEEQDGGDHFAGGAVFAAQGIGAEVEHGVDHYFVVEGGRNGFDHLVEGLHAGALGLLHFALRFLAPLDGPDTKL